MHVRADGEPSSTSAGPAFATGWGFGDRLSVGFGFNVGYGIHMIGRSEPFGRFDDLALRYTHPLRERATVPFAELALCQSEFGNDEETSMNDGAVTWRLGVEHFLTLGTALEVSLSPTSGTLNDRDVVFGQPATRSQRFRSVAVDVRLTFRPWSRRRRD